MPCPSCGFESDPETGEVYDVTYPCPECGLGGAHVTTPASRVASRYALAAGYFSIGDPVLYGKWKNMRGIIKAFGVDEKGNPTITIEPVPKGRKQDLVMGLFRIWKAPA